jgi:hypothetical protein
MEYYVTTHDKGGFTIGKVLRRNFSTDQVIIETIIPFTGNNEIMRNYYAKGRTFQVTYQDGRWLYGDKFFCTKESHPEYFI